MTIVNTVLDLVTEDILLEVLKIFDTKSYVLQSKARLDDDATIHLSNMIKEKLLAYSDINKNLVEEHEVILQDGSCSITTITRKYKT